jgi:hypothetical protein
MPLLKLLKIFTQNSLAGVADAFEDLLLLIFKGGAILVLIISILIALNIPDSMFPAMSFDGRVDHGSIWFLRVIIFLLTFFIGMIPIILSVGLAATFTSINNNLKEIKNNQKK